MTNQYKWVDNPTVSGVARCDTDVLNDCLMHLKYNNAPVSPFPLFSMMMSDHVLSGQDALGWALQGSVISMAYPDAVNQIIDEYNSGFDENVRGIDCRIAANGHVIADISRKTDIDKLFYESGIADFYILDKENKEIYLPRTKWFHQFTEDTSLVNRFNEAGLPNVEGKVTGIVGYAGNSKNGALSQSSGTNARIVGGNGSCTINSISLNLLDADPVYGRSDTVQPPGSNKLLYYKVGNTVVNETNIDVGNVLLLLQQKADNDLRNSAGNLSAEARNYFSGLSMPSDRYVDLTLGADLTTYTAPAHGYFSFSAAVNKVSFIALNLFNEDKSVELATVRDFHESTLASHLGVLMGVRKGQKVVVQYNNIDSTRYFRFIYAEGAE